MRRLAWTIAAMLLATPAAAQDRPRAQRQALLELAHVLGESHALRQACEGAGDQYWRAWMSRLLENEATGDGFDRRLRDAFNAGYVETQVEYPGCTDAAMARAARAAQRGRALSRAVSGG